MKTWANIMLGIWLIISGMINLGGIRFSGSGTVLPVLAIVTGILFMLSDTSERILPRMGNILLGLWLIATGLLPLLHIHLAGIGAVLAVLSVTAGALMLIRR